MGQTISGIEGGAIDGHLILTLCIMVVTGILGGIANYFINERDTSVHLRTITKHAILGTVAALTVPLFLNMISSHMLEATRLKSSELFVFSGFCLLYVVVSRRFFENLSVHLMRQVEQVRKDVKHLQTSSPATPQALSTGSHAMEHERHESPVASIVELPRNAVSFGDIELMRAIGEGNAIYGALSALAAKTTLPRDQVAPRLAALKSMGLIESKIDDKNVVRWYLTPKAKSLIDGIAAAASLEERRDAS